MPFSDWTLHPDSANDYVSGRSSSDPLPVGGGVNVWSLTAPSGAALKRLTYVNDLVRTVNGSQEISGVFRLAAGATKVRLGLITMWDGLSLDALDTAYVVEMRALTGGLPRLRVSNGPALAGDTILQSTVDLAFDNWYQILVQYKFDNVFNLQLRVALSDAEVNDISSPSYALQFEPISIPKADARTGGKFAFFVESQQSSFDLLVDGVQISTTLTAL